jgi:hypothetical protein
MVEFELLALQIDKNCKVKYQSKAFTRLKKAHQLTSTLFPDEKKMPKGESMLKELLLDRG